MLDTMYADRPEVEKQLIKLVMHLLSERTSGTPGVTLNSWPSRWIIIPCMACSRPLCISNRYILRPIYSVIYYVHLAVRTLHF